MEWLVLILLVPLILVPVVALAGFSGCFTKPPRPEPRVPAPSELVATATGADRIQLSWVDNSTNASHFRIRRSVDMGQTFQLIEEVPAPATTHEDSEGLEEGEYYVYQVFAFANGVESEGSNIDGERTHVWMSALDLGMNAALDGPGLSGFCVVQRLPGGLLSLTGTAVRITVRGSGIVNANLRLDAVTISRAAPPGSQEWDSIEAPVAVTFQGGSAGILVAGTQSETSDEISYAFEAGKDLIVAFDIGAPGQVGRRTGVAGAQAYSRVNPTTKQAGIADRVDGFSPSPDVNTVFIVEKIEVLVKVPD